MSRSGTKETPQSDLNGAPTKAGTGTMRTQVGTGTMRTHASHISEIMVTHRQELRGHLLREKLLAEFVGTFFLVLAVGAAVAGGGAMAPVAIGLVLSVQIYTFGAVSGGFLNPAVTLAVLLSGRGKIDPKDAGLYMVAQCLGGIAAGLLSLAGTSKSFCFDYAATPAGGWGTSLELEIFFTMALCGTVLAAGTSNDAPNHYFGFAIGMTVTGGALASGGFDQGSFNPAVTLGINIANYANSNRVSTPSAGAWFLFLLAPLVGGALAAAVFRGTRSNEYIDEAPAGSTGAAQPDVEQQEVSASGKAEV